MNPLMCDLGARLAVNHYRELLRQADAERLAQRVFKRRDSVVIWMRMRLGKAFIALGLRLAPEAPIMLPLQSQSNGADYRCNSSLK